MDPPGGGGGASFSELPGGVAGFAGAGAGGGGEAPSLLWLVILGAVLCWWIWPWLAKLRGESLQEAAILGGVRKEASGLRLPQGPAAGAAAAAAEAAAAAAAAADGAAIPEANAGRLADDLSFELAEEFRETFSSASASLAEILTGPPSGQAYTEAVSALSKLSDILDKVFSSFGAPEELARVCRLREGSKAFARDFGGAQVAEAMKGLLRTAGFERLQAEAASSGDVSPTASEGAVWTFPDQDALARLKGLTVRLCLQKSSELQRARGSGRFLHKDNSAVIPSVEDASLAELIELYRMRPPPSSFLGDIRASARERNFEADVRVKLNQRREGCGLDPVSLHEGLAVVARSIADAQRTRVRRNADDIYPAQQVALEVQAAVGKLPLPPGFAVAHLHWSSTELPRLFGLANTRGGGAKGATSGGDGEGSDAAADILANEAVGYWAARQQDDVYWPVAAICGVGAALDYTVNRGFAVAIVVGYEGPGAAQGASTGELRRRSAAAAAAAKQRRETEPPVRFTPAGSHKPRLTGFRDLPKEKGG